MEIKVPLSGTLDTSFYKITRHSTVIVSNMSPIRKLVALYGSETGTATDVSERMGRCAKRRYFRTSITSLDHYDFNNLINENLVVFVCSTTGQGDTPSNMKNFWKKLMRRNLPSNSLASLQFAVIGLGDSSYAKYNVVAKKLFKRLVQLGAEPVIPLVLGDDQHEIGVDAMLDPSITDLWTVLMLRYPLPPGETIIPDDVLLPSKYNVEVTKSHINNVAYNYTAKLQDGDLRVELLANERVTAQDHYQDVRLLSFDAPGVRYIPGDVLVVLPENGVDAISEFITFMNLDPTDTFLLHPNDSNERLPPTLPQPCSIEYVVRKHFDINSIPRRYFFEILAYFSENDMEKEKLLELCSPEGQDERYAYCNKVRRSILETLQDFPDASSRVPHNYLFDLIPPIQPRSFSIASSPLKHKDTIQLIVAVVNYKTKLRKPRKGLCSNWLASLDPSTNRIKLNVSIKSGTMDFKHSMNDPVICIGPGTGIAPLRSLIHNRCELGLSDNVLFFGCRNAHKDFYFQSEWTTLCAQNKLALHTAFSRDQEQKVYVQHVIREKSLDLWKLIDQCNAYIFVAGNATRMPTDVRDAIKHVIKQHGCLTDEDAERYVTELERCHRYQIEAWS